jgi:hypothetical protein
MHFEIDTFWAGMFYTSRDNDNTAPAMSNSLLENHSFRSVRRYHEGLRVVIQEVGQCMTTDLCFTVS